MNKEKIELIVKRIVNWLLKEEYDKIFQNDHAKSLTSEEIRIAINEYPGKLTLPPEDGFREIDLYEINENEVAFDFDLWFNNEKSDLTLSARAIYDNNVIEYCIENIHVL